jgi:hypothetical protein
VVEKAGAESKTPLDAKVVPTTPTITTGEQAAVDTPQMERMTLVLESAVVNVVKLIKVAAEMPESSSSGQFYVIFIHLMQSNAEFISVVCNFYAIFKFM